MAGSSRSAVRLAWQRGRCAAASWHMIGCPLTAEIVVRAGRFDAAVVDLQHGLVEASAAAVMLHAVQAAGAAPFVRLAGGDAAAVGRMLDLGALGVICPMVNTRAESEAFVDACLYPADGGRRSYGPVRAAAVYGANYPAISRESTVRLAMIETTEALENIENILGTPHLDGIFIGPSDLALGLGREASACLTDPVVVGAIDAVLAATKKRGRRAGIYVGDTKTGRLMAAKGFDLVSCGADLGHLVTAMARQRHDLGETED